MVLQLFNYLVFLLITIIIIYFWFDKYWPHSQHLQQLKVYISTDSTILHTLIVNYINRLSICFGKSSVKKVQLILKQSRKLGSLRNCLTLKTNQTAGYKLHLITVKLFGVSENITPHVFYLDLCSLHAIYQSLLYSKGDAKMFSAVWISSC